MPQFASRDPLTPAFWDERFAGDFTPWDRGAVPEQLKAFVAAQARPLTVLIPGCGLGHEVALFSQAGSDVTAIDFSPRAVQDARARLGPWAARVLEADFFAFAPARPLDAIYERAFLCALPRSLWPQVAARWAQLLAPGTRLFGYFYLGNTIKGPPFGATQAEIDGLLTPYFDCVNDRPVADSVAVFAGHERWQVWVRKSPSATIAGQNPL